MLRSCTPIVEALRRLLSAEELSVTWCPGARSLPDWLTLEFATLVVDLLTLGVTTFLAILALHFTATPRLKISLTVNDAEQFQVSPGSELELMFTMKNVGHWYAKPAATSMIAYVNFDPAFQFVIAHWGSQLHNPVTATRRGKGGSKYFRANQIHLPYDEPPERISAVIIAPDTPGRYSCWIAAFSDEGDCGVHRFFLDVV